MHRLRIALDQHLRERCGPELRWTWELLLTGIGYAWEEVRPEEPADIAHVALDAPRGPARLVIAPDPEGWRNHRGLRLRDATPDPTWVRLVFEHQTSQQHLHPADGSLICHRDVVLDAFWLATLVEESDWPKDRHGFADLGGTSWERTGLLRLAPASSIGAGLGALLQRLGYPPPLPRWPHNRLAAACASHDVDYPEVIRWLEPARVLRRRGIAGLRAACEVAAGRRSHWHFDSWTEAERRVGTRSAFFFVPRRGSLREYALGTPDPFYDIRAPRFKRLFRHLAAAGAEIGLHASYRAYEQASRLTEEKEALEEAAGQPVVGVRHHYWHLDPDNPMATLRAHETAGLSYDASLAHERYLGWRNGLCWPFFPYDPVRRGRLNTLQMPTAWMDDHLFGSHRYNPGDPSRLLRELADTVVAHGGCLLVDVHDYVFDEVLFPGWARLYEELLSDLGRRELWLTTPKDIAGHWRARFTSLYRESRWLE